MKPTMIQTNTVRAITLLAGLSLATSAKATVPVSDLPDFDNLPNFAQLGNQLQYANNTINGNVGVSDGGTLLRNSINNTINGDLHVGNGATSTGGGTTTGST